MGIHCFAGGVAQTSFASKIQNLKNRSGNIPNELLRGGGYKSGSKFYAEFDFDIRFSIWSSHSL